MINCTYVRSNLDRFLNASLGSDVDEQIREHLDHCRSCCSAMTTDHTLDLAFSDKVDEMSADFTDRVLSQFPVRANSAILFRYLCGLFAASSFVGVSVFAYVRHYLHPHALVFPTATESNDGLTGLITLLSSVAASPTFRYAMLALTATLLSTILIFVVDLPRRRDLSPVKDAE